MNCSRFPVAACVIVLLAAVLTGCATKKIDWTRRIGAYTFDQAVTEFGPPDKQAKLTDGTRVAEWLTRRGYSQLYATGGYYGAPYHGWGFPPTYIAASSPDYFLRLTFGPDGRLRAWKKLAK